VLGEMESSLRMAEEGVDRANRLVKDLSRFTRLTTETTRCRLDEIVAEALELFRMTHPGASATILESLEPTPLLLVDKSKIQQVVLNLVGNANEALRHGGTIRVETCATPMGAALVVQDDGPGIPGEEMGRIFEPFFTTKPEGMGLGLSIVRRIIELHRGTIRCDSSPGAGTTFTVHLPA
jgi:signal transduction histidine kinase